MKKSIIFFLSCFSCVQIFCQIEIRTDLPAYYSNTQRIIPMLNGSYVTLNDGYSVTKQFVMHDKNDQLMFESDGIKLHPFISYARQKDSISILNILFDGCDFGGFDLVMCSPNEIKRKFNYGERIDNQLNIYSSNSNKIFVNNFVTNESSAFDSPLNQLNNFVALEKDTVLFGSEMGMFFTATPDGVVKLLPTLFDGKIKTKNDIIDFSPNYFYIKSTDEVFAKKGLHNIGKIAGLDPSKDNIKEVNGKIYTHKANKWEEYDLDNSGKLLTPKTVFQQFESKKMFINDMVYISGKYLIAGYALNAKHPSDNTFYGINDFHLKLDSLNQEFTPRNDIKFEILTQTKPQYDNNCYGYKFSDLEILIENNGIDTLQKFQLKGGAYGSSLFVCIPDRVEIMEVNGLKIAPNSSQIVNIKDYCVHSFGKTKDSIVSFCLRAVVPNNSVDGDISNNMDCFSFKSFDKELAANEIDLSKKANLFYANETINVTIHDDFQTAHLMLFDITGKQILTNEIKEKNSQFEIGTSIPSGLYLVNLVIDNQVIVTKKIVLY